MLPAATGSGRESGRALLDDGELCLELADAPEDAGAQDIEGVGDLARR